MGTKQQILKAIEEFPDDAGVEDALDRLYLLYKVATDVALTPPRGVSATRAIPKEEPRTPRTEVRACILPTRSPEPSPFFGCSCLLSRLEYLGVRNAWKLRANL